MLGHARSESLVNFKVLPGGWPAIRLGLSICRILRILRMLKVPPQHPVKALLGASYIILAVVRSYFIAFHMGRQLQSRTITILRVVLRDGITLLFHGEQCIPATPPVLAITSPGHHNVL